METRFAGYNQSGVASSSLRNLQCKIVLLLSNNNNMSPTTKTEIVSLVES